MADFTDRIKEAAQDVAHGNFREAGRDLRDNQNTDTSDNNKVYYQNDALEKTQSNVPEETLREEDITVEDDQDDVTTMVDDTYQDLADEAARDAADSQPAENSSQNQTSSQDQDSSQDQVSSQDSSQTTSQSSDDADSLDDSQDDDYIYFEEIDIFFDEPVDSDEDSQQSNKEEKQTVTSGDRC